MLLVIFFMSFNKVLSICNSSPRSRTTQKRPGAAVMKRRYCFGESSLVQKPGKHVITIICQLPCTRSWQTNCKQLQPTWRNPFGHIASVIDRANGTTQAIFHCCVSHIFKFTACRHTLPAVFPDQLRYQCFLKWKGRLTSPWALLWILAATEGSSDWISLKPFTAEDTVTSLISVAPTHYSEMGTKKMWKS